MSRIGKLPVEIPSGVEVKLQDNKIIVKGPKGELSLDIMDIVNVAIEDNKVVVTRDNDEKQKRAAHGMTRAIIANLIKGVTEGFCKQLEINGVGYRAEGGGSEITLHLGFSHPVKMKAPEGVTIELDKEKKNVLNISGIDKQKVGQFAAEIREKRPPEPYKGKGVKYIDEHITRKAGKKAGK
ncbi:MAG: 50S ribosomal protein L6 [Candidatus Gracilibacteria bacterium]|jgi:large subunit ribosomal protein L6|nr:50S ribosomal protein L6 [Candidatus Gracilibacteria bacterium]